MLKISKSLGQLFGKKAKTQQQTKLNFGEEEQPIYNEKVTPIEGLPFAVVKKEEHQYVVIFGKHLITDRVFYSKPQAENWAKQMDWLSILNVIGIYVEHAIKEQNLSKNN